MAEPVKGRIHSIESMGLVDGPGVRTIFFLQGCPLRCSFCHNPDTQATTGGTLMTPEEVLAKAKRYRPYHREDGGVTFSGGEPLLQGEFLAATLKLLHDNGFNTCLDTSGYGDIRYYDKIFSYVDTILLDVKAFNPTAFRKIAKVDMQIFKNFIENLWTYGFKGNIWLRHVMLPGYTDNEASMIQLIRVIEPIANFIERIEILPYHTMGVDKYKALGRKYELEGLPPMDKAVAKKYQILANKIFALYIHSSRYNRKVESRMSTENNIRCELLPPEQITALENEFKEIPLIHDIISASSETMWTHFKFFRVNKGDFVFRTGDSANYMYIICRGHVKIFHNTADGREQILYIYNKGDFIGGLNVLGGKDYLYMGQALEDSIIAAFPKADFDRYVAGSPAILQRILLKSFDRIRWAEDLINRLTTSNATMKAAALLLRLKDNFGVPSKDGIRLDLTINREEMGNYSGLTRETITRKLGEFKDMGYIDFIGNKVIIIKNLEALEDFCF